MLAAEIVPRRWSGRAPFQRSGFPWIIWRRLAPEPTVNQVVDKNKLSRTGDEGSDGYPFVDGDQRLQEVIRERRVAADIPGHSEVMERHKDAIRAHKAEPEMNFAQGFVHHSSGHLREPEISSGEDAEHGRDAHHHVEVSYHEESRMEHDLDRGLAQKKTTDASTDEHRTQPNIKTQP